ncbi:MAG: DMT family transporter, partial [Bdellovibrionales bacterium]|nr:DMT family transporter [Bdellovibrionales bacterium]
MGQRRCGLGSGASAIIAASVLWGVGYFLRKLILTDVSPILLAFLNAWVAAVALAALFRIQPHEVWRTFRAQPLYYLGLAFLGVAFGTTLLFYGLRLLDLGVAILLEKLQPVFTVILAWFIFGERYEPKILVLMAVAVAASYLVAGGTLDVTAISDASWTGFMAVLVASGS